MLHGLRALRDTLPNEVELTNKVRSFKFSLHFFLHTRWAELICRTYLNYTTHVIRWCWNDSQVDKGSSLLQCNILTYWAVLISVSVARYLLEDHRNRLLCCMICLFASQLLPASYSTCWRSLPNKRLWVRNISVSLPSYPLSPVPDYISWHMSICMYNMPKISTSSLCHTVHTQTTAFSCHMRYTS